MGGSFRTGGGVASRAAVERRAIGARAAEAGTQGRRGPRRVDEDLQGVRDEHVRASRRLELVVGPRVHHHL